MLPEADGLAVTPLSFVTVSGSKNPHEDLLGEVFGCRVVAGLMQKQRYQSRLPEADKLAEGLGITITNPQHQFG
jgi:hypothetical protein